MLIVDCSNGDAWPFPSTNETNSDLRNRGLRLVSLLKVAAGDDSLKLIEDASLNDHSRSLVH